MDNLKKIPLNYDNLHLPKNPGYFLETDCAVVEGLPAIYVAGVKEPVKFSATALIRYKGGRTRFLINLIEYVVEDSCAVFISEGDILQVLEVDPEAIMDFVVMSDRLMSRLNVYYTEGDIFAYGMEGHVFPLEANEDIRLGTFMQKLAEISADTDNRHLFEAQVHAICAFIFGIGYKVFSLRHDDAEFTPGTHERVTKAFLALVRDNFRNERFLDFYSSRLGITPKHLSRTIRRNTGISAVDWITRYVVLESKVLLRSTTMSIKDISAHLNFPSQSFFGKYFKRYTGISPIEFRKSLSK